MVLVFLLLLTFLALAIVGELEPKGTSAPAGKCAGKCPGCGQAAEEDWLVCPRCRHLLQAACPGCDRQRAIFHAFCPWCGQRREKNG
jgi:hypothetical protein